MATVVVPDETPVAEVGEGQRLLRTIAATTAVGLGLGLVVGGIGGRVAMRLLFLTSSPHLRGMISDDGFPIGRFDVGATVNLLVVGAVLGVIGAFVYLAVRPSLLGPTWLRRLGCGIGAGAVVGSMIVHTDGRDFTLLGPRWFAIALFVAIPAVFGVLAAVYVERAVRPDGWFLTGPRRLTLLPLAAFLFLPLTVVVGLPVLAVVLGRRAAAGSPAVAGVVAHPVTRWAVRAAWATAGVLGAWALVGETLELLTAV